MILFKHIMKKVNDKTKELNKQEWQKENIISNIKLFVLKAIRRDIDKPLYVNYLIHIISLLVLLTSLEHPVSMKN